MPDIAVCMSRDAAEQCLDEIRLGTLKIKAKLIELYEGRGWEALGYPSWRECIQSELQIGKSQAYRLLDAAYVSQEISPIGENVSESQARELAKAPQGKRAETLEKAKESAAAQGRTKPTAKDIRDAVESGNGTTPTHDATQQDDAEPRMADTDGDAGPCPQGGDHDIFTLHGERYCGRCKTRFSADDDCDDEPSVMIGSIDPANAEEAYDTSSLDDFCQWTIDQCTPIHREQLADRLQYWAKQARGVK